MKVSYARNVIATIPLELTNIRVILNMLARNGKKKLLMENFKKKEGESTSINLKPKEVNRMLSVHFKARDILVSVKTGEKYPILKVYIGESIVGGGDKKQKLVLWDSKHEVEFDVRVDKVDEKLYYVEEGIPLMQVPKVIKEPRAPKMTEEGKAMMREYINNPTNNLSEWLKKDLLKNI